MSRFPARELVIVVHGSPVSQGSMRAVAKGVIRRDHGPELVAWRRRIAAAAQTLCGPSWRPLEGAVEVSAVFTVPRRSSDPNRAVHATGWRDTDKLERAVGDALCPNSPTAFRVIASDMRITTWCAAKTNPRPLHTHRDALHEPGVTIRVRIPDLAPHDLTIPAPVSTRAEGINA